MDYTPATGGITTPAQQRLLLWLQTEDRYFRRLAALDIAFGGEDGAPSGYEIADAIDQMTDGYLEALLWTAHDAPTDDEEPITWDDAGYRIDDVAPTLRASVRDHLIDVVTDHPLATRMYGRARQFAVADGTVWEHFGHDYLLTRDHHGAGFWDRGIGALGDYLTDIAQANGSSESDMGLYLDAEGKVSS